MQEVSGVYTSPCLDTDELKMALRARKVSGAFEKRVPGLEPGPLDAGPSALTMRTPHLHHSLLCEQQRRLQVRTGQHYTSNGVSFVNKHLYLVAELQRGKRAPAKHHG